eukprot:scaffold6974_cov20-Tisochrysis_lutea.AAC.3
MTGNCHWTGALKSLHSQIFSSPHHAHTHALPFSAVLFQDHGGLAASGLGHGRVRCVRALREATRAVWISAGRLPAGARALSAHAGQCAGVYCLCEQHAMRQVGGLSASCATCTLAILKYPGEYLLLCVIQGLQPGTRTHAFLDAKSSRLRVDKSALVACAAAAMTGWCTFTTSPPLLPYMLVVAQAMFPEMKIASHPMNVAVQAMFLMALQLSKLYEAGSMSHEQASLVKSWNTLRGREVVALGREVLGGNGILTDFNVAKRERRKFCACRLAASIKERASH